jgi:hypothetical protein
MIKDFMPQMIEEIDKDLYRFKFRHVISILKSLNRVDLLSKELMANLHRMVNKYLVEYISTNKKDINGSEYATLVH